MIVSVCWETASEASCAPCTPCSQNARQTMTRKQSRKPAKRRPIRRSIKRIRAGLPRAREAFHGDADVIGAGFDHPGPKFGRQSQPLGGGLAADPFGAEDLRNPRVEGRVLGFQ